MCYIDGQKNKYSDIVQLNKVGRLRWLGYLLNFRSVGLGGSYVKEKKEEEEEEEERKSTHVTGRGGPYGCETSRIQHCLDSRLIDGAEVVSPDLALSPRKIPSTHFY
jgi:hypothetical protein